MEDTQTYPALTPEEIAIQKLRSSISDIIADKDIFNDDYYLLAWLKARNFKPAKTEEMIRNALAWREKTNLNTDMTEANIEELANEFPIILEITPASNGIPLAYAHVGKLDNRKVYRKYGWQALTHYVMKMFLHFEEAMIVHNQKRNAETREITKESISGIIAVFNIEGFPMTPSPFIDSSRICISLVTALTSYFPFLIHHVFILNVTKVFSTLLKVIRPLIPARGNTFNVYTQDEDAWKGSIKELLRSENLPHFLQDHPEDALP